ncbi:surfactant B protein, putative [Trichomonas vaginalis G3]|uniref:Surfactant B protein, putative n=2 Tax=Trichomonas vaginalis TaxID=5722 RepID=A2DVG2_TRIV3|nr:saposin-like type B, region 1 family [Trichomonas vaginalis G3]EAY15641.1 surfactant B protein, putative [Trichomonas vaginalis G3]KAI5530247.1 saposin-like type B, region 1 family [Trichomonas vaginalis G3]|eukprot:XP_001327864.1 surfactant B protein [Trichomonas vaginalis G3]
MFFALLGLMSAAAVKPRATKVGDSTQKCVMCKFYVSMIEDYLEDGKTEQEIIEKLESYCQYVTADLRVICDKLVEVGVPAIIKYLKDNEPPAAVCKLIKFCKD